MPAKKRSASATKRRVAKPASKKRVATSKRRKAAPIKRTAIKADLQIPKLKLSMPLDARKIAAIQRCLAKGQLTITVSRVDLITGRAGDPYIYD